MVKIKFVINNSERKVKHYINNKVVFYCCKEKQGRVRGEELKELGVFQISAMHRKKYADNPKDWLSLKAKVLNS